MATLDIAFANGRAAVANYGQRDKVKFVGTWVAGDTWNWRHHNWCW
jgi:hypothetical protein